MSNFKIFTCRDVALLVHMFSDGCLHSWSLRAKEHGVATSVACRMSVDEV